MKVRLKQAAHKGVDLFSEVFQFHEGPIKTPSLPALQLTASWFQFHEGPIKT